MRLLILTIKGMLLYGTILWTAFFVCVIDSIMDYSCSLFFITLGATICSIILCTLVISKKECDTLLLSKYFSKDDKETDQVNTDY